MPAIKPPSCMQFCSHSLPPLVRNVVLPELRAQGRTWEGLDASPIKAAPGPLPCNQILGEDHIKKLDDGIDILWHQQGCTWMTFMFSTAFWDGTVDNTRFLRQKRWCC